MKGIILCGGKGARLHPLTQITNKNLLPVYNKPVISYGIETLVRSGVKEVTLVPGGTEAGSFLTFLGDGKRLGLDRLEYTYHEPQTGVLDALYLARHFATATPVIVLFADNLTDDTFAKDIRSFSSGTKLFLKKVTDPRRYGVPCFNRHGQITDIKEKPQKPCSPLAITGIFIYDHTLFDRIEKILPHHPTADISYLNRSYLKDRQITWREIKKFWLDIGTIPDLFHANYHYAKKAGWTSRPHHPPPQKLSLRPAQLPKQLFL